MNKTTLYFLSLLSVPVALFGMEEGAPATPAVDEAAVAAARQELELYRQQAAAAHERLLSADRSTVKQLAELDEEDARASAYDAKRREYCALHPDATSFQVICAMGPRPTGRQYSVLDQDGYRHQLRTSLERSIAAKAHK